MPRLQDLGHTVYADGIYYRTLPQHPVLTGKNYEGGTHPALSQARQAVEHSFRLMKDYWSFLRHTEKLKVYQGPPGTLKNILVTTAILTNAHTLLYGNQVSKFFGSLGHVTLADYFN